MGVNTIGGYHRVCSVTEDARVAWIVRLVQIGADGEERCADVMKVDRPDDLADIANLGLTLAEAKRVLANQIVVQEKEAESPLVTQHREGGRRQQIVLELAVRPAALNPDVAGTKPVAQVCTMTATS